MSDPTIDTLGEAPEFQRVRDQIATASVTDPAAVQQPAEAEGELARERTADLTAAMERIAAVGRQADASRVSGGADGVTNEALRAELGPIAGDAAQIAEAAGLAEQHLAALRQLVSAGEAAVELKKFDPAAVNAVARATELISGATLSHWGQRAERLAGAASAGLSGLAPYRDTEDLVAATGVDPTTLDVD